MNRINSQFKPKLVSNKSTNVKHFAAKDMRTALQLAQAELGVDAAIVSTRDLDYGVEISVICDPLLPYLAANENNTELPQLQSLQQQINSLQKLLGANFKLQNITKSPTPSAKIKKSEIETHLAKQGLSPQVIKQLKIEAYLKLKPSKRKQWQQILLGIVHKIHISGLNPSKAIVLVGPSFSDILQSAEAIADYYLVTHQVRPIIITLNCSSEQWLMLNLLGQKLNISVRKELPKQQQIGQIVLSTPKNLPPYATPIMVLPAMWHEENLTKAIKTFCCQEVIFTQFNLSRNLGAILNLLLQYNLNLTAFTNPDLVIPKPYQLVSSILSPNIKGT